MTYRPLPRNLISAYNSVLFHVSRNNIFLINVLILDVPWNDEISVTQHINKNFHILC